MSKRDKILYFVICVFLTASVAGVYLPVRNHDFVMYDDNTYVTENKHVASGLSWANIRWAFTHNHASNWHPLTWISHMTDVELYGVQAGGPHVTNAVIHTANTVLLFAALAYMTGALWASAFIAALFGLHPLHVESVAWVSERKDVLSTFFMILTLWSYAGYVRHGGMRRYILTAAFFALGLMSKPMLVTLPFILLLLDYWPLNRLEINNSRQIYRCVYEKIPFFALSAASSVVTFLVQKFTGAVVSIEFFNLRIRLANAFVSYISYIWKMLWPTRLAVFYPHLGENVSMAAAVVCVFLLAVLTICFVYFGIRRKYLLVGWLWYVGMLVPVIGLVQVGSQAMADRYMYMPMTGLFIIAAWGVRELSEKLGWRKSTVGFFAALVVCASAGLTARQVRYWHNSMSLFEHTIAISPQAYDVRNNYANLLKEAGRFSEAIKNFKIVLSQKPHMAEAYYNLGNTLRKMDRLNEAIENYKKAAKFKPDFVEAHYNLGATLAQAGRGEEALAAFNKAIELKPKDSEILSSIGLAFSQKGDLDKAAEYYRKAIEVDPNCIVAHGRLGLAFGNQGRFNEALEQFHIVLQARPADVEMWRNSAILLERQGKIDEAIDYFRKALSIKPDDAEMRRLLDAAISKKEGR